MYIETLHVENVGPFTQLDAYFNKSMNVVIGMNGVGKTSMLRCIASCLTHYHMGNMRLRKNATLRMNCKLGDKGETYGAEKMVDKDQEYRKFNPVRNSGTVLNDPHGKTTLSKDE